MMAKQLENINGFSIVRVRDIVVILLLILMFSVIDSRLSITSSTPSGTVMKSGETSSLFCNSSSPWFLCIWEGPRGLACQCQTEDGGVSSMCPGNHRVTLSGRETSCMMTVTGVEEGDAGMYRCVLADRQEIVTVRKNMEVGVGVMTVLEWRSQGQQVEVGEGQEIELVCQATGGYPPPQITIEGIDFLSNRDTSPSLNARSQSVTYVGRWDDNNTLVTCTSIQKDEWGTEIYISSVKIWLRVMPAAKFIAVSVFPFWIYIVIGVGVFLLLLILSLVLYCCCKKNKEEAVINVQGQDMLVPVHTEGQGHTAQYNFDANGKLRRNNSFRQALNKPVISPSQAPTYAGVQKAQNQSYIGFQKAQNQSYTGVQKAKNLSYTGMQNQSYASAQKGQEQSYASAQKAQEQSYAGAQKLQEQSYAGALKAQEQSYASVQKAQSQSYASSQKVQEQSYNSVQRAQSQTYATVQKTDKTDNQIKTFKTDNQGITTSSPIYPAMNDQYIGKTSVLNLDSFQENNTGISNSSYLSNNANSTAFSNNTSVTALSNNANVTALSNIANIPALSNNANVAAFSNNANITALLSKADISGISSTIDKSRLSCYTDNTGLSINADIAGISSNGSNYQTTIVDEYNFKQTRSTVTERSVNFSGSKVENEDKYVTDNYLLNQYKLKDCDPIDPKYKSYSDIIKEHLVHNPTVEVSQSLVEVKKKTFAADSINVDYNLSYS